jgi:hypothetical protein
MLTPRDTSAESNFRATVLPMPTSSEGRGKSVEEGRKALLVKDIQKLYSLLKTLRKLSASSTLRGLWIISLSKRVRAKTVVQPAETVSFVYDHSLKVTCRAGRVVRKAVRVQPTGAQRAAPKKTPS